MLDIIHGVSLDEYFADSITPREALSVSVAKKLLKSHKHGWAEHPRYRPGTVPRKPPSEKMKLGTVLDEILTNNSQRLVVVDGYKDFRTDAAKAIKAKAESEAKLALVRSKYDAAKERAESVTKNLAYHSIDLSSYSKQVCIVWDVEASNGNWVQCKCLLDYLSPDCTMIRDLKSIGNAQPGEKLNRHLLGMGYHIQAAAYVSAVEAVYPELAGRVRFENVLVEEDWPHVPLVTKYNGKAMTLGRVQWQKAIDRWEYSTRTGQWPGYMQNAEPVEIDVPSYLDAELYDEGDNEEEEGD